MECEVLENEIVYRGVADLNLGQTLDCGQSFRWEEQENGDFRGIAFDREITVRLKRGDLYIIGGKAEDNRLWSDYFDLDLDYGAIKRELSKLSPVLKSAAEYAPGIRILRQDSWEALCSFIISQNNNIPRIKGIIKRLCECFGDKTADGGYTFPSADKLSGLSVEDLSPLRSGFRAKYLIDASQRVSCGEISLDDVQKMPIDEARQSLMKIKGVGPKVAECALLYGMHRLECFPMDVWMKRAMAVLLPEFTIEDLGRYAGIAQQYIFHYSRMHPELFE
ncbi:MULTISPECIES: DNA-3-methyladenine glycosylase [unclassified Ruminococcus]|uniref:DNA-3-methyladenine glycosylase family protein n=1 Tax=unclassified Ruminococcus TaxID=2608920 RepID=UPI00210A3D84|nr:MULTISPECIES: DNA glycosylase [unclassified Ruminococcus]MCQ4022160.1 DNA-3-methyladenine glycosylase 2 family protein [Ruminococcus sp. zg-924]MCQ4115558.1 DNA-3-methyladenine glycosylase 2 family protein [Ruminococcus sp. zg-921]